MSKLDENLGYFSRQQCSVQWQSFLNAFAGEFGQQIPVAELRVLMSRLGVSMAQNMIAPAGVTMAELEQSINDIWFEMSWGWVSLIEKDSGLYIEHHVSPLQSAFGADALAWTPAILEGIYAHWFAMLGAGSDLQLTQFEPAQPDSMVIVFRFGRAA